MDFFGAKFYSSAQGRFGSIDPLTALASLGDPQTFNRYAYVRNNPLNLTDPTGMMTEKIEHGGSDYDAEVFSKLQELRHREQPWVMGQDPKKAEQKPPTVVGPVQADGSREIPGDVIVSNIYASANKLESNPDDEPPAKKLQGTVEVDETYVGASPAIKAFQSAVVVQRKLKWSAWLSVSVKFVFR